MFRFALGSLAGLAVLGASVARAHFIWLDVQPAPGGGSQAALYFSEEPEPGEPHLVGKATAAKVWLRGVDGNVAEVKFAAPEGEESAALVADCPGKAAASLEGMWDYGVYQRGPAVGVLLQYYAKRLNGDWLAHPELARADRLKLDVVPEYSGDKLAVQVLLDGKPNAGGDVVFVDPQGEHHQVETDKQGRAQVDAGAGRWAVRVGHVDPAKSGERDGKKYNQTWHYATLVLDVPSADAKPQTEVTALDTLKRARDGRAVWDDFPGFASDLTVRYEDKELAGTLEIDADGGVTLKLPESPASDWAEEQLYSLVQHRMPEGEVSEGNVTFVEEEADHPLGRKISLGDSDFSSAYRIKDDVIMEVNRSMGPMRFTISVMEIERNAENKYLPRSFTMNFFDAKTGDLRNSLGYWNAWQRIGKFDLPKEILEIDAHKGGSTTKQITFHNTRLLEPK